MPKSRRSGFNPPRGPGRENTTASRLKLGQQHRLRFPSFSSLFSFFFLDTTFFQRWSFLLTGYSQRCCPHRTPHLIFQWRAMLALLQCTAPSSTAPKRKGRETRKMWEWVLILLEMKQSSQRDGSQIPTVHNVTGQVRRCYLLWHRWLCSTGPER